MKIESNPTAKALVGRGNMSFKCFIYSGLYCVFGAVKMFLSLKGASASCLVNHSIAKRSIWEAVGTIATDKETFCLWRLARSLG